MHNAPCKIAFCIVSAAIRIVGMMFCNILVIGYFVLCCDSFYIIDGFTAYRLIKKAAI